jgi:hypothetical protein
VKNRISDYEAGWLSFLVRQGIATDADARDAMNRVAQAAIDELARKRRLKKRSKKRRDEE